MANNIFIDFLPPWIETGIQPAFYDKESGSVLQQTARMYAKVNELVESVNHQNENIDEYIEKFNELKDYVDDYFTNLDVQTEINQKLDMMAQDGTLTNLIAPLLNDIQTDLNEQIDTMDQYLKSSITSINSKVDAVVGGTPRAVDSVDDMTDEDSIYVLTTDGNWYYYNGEEWTAGGTYNATAIGLLSIIGGMIKQNTITKDKLKNTINILSLATTIMPNKAITGWSNNDGLLTINNNTSHVLIFNWNSLTNKLLKIKISDITVPSGYNASYVSYNSTNYSSKSRVTYPSIQANDALYDSITGYGVTRQTNSNHDCIAITVNLNYEIEIGENYNTGKIVLGNSVMLDAMDMLSQSIIEEGVKITGYSANYLPTTSIDYRFNTVRYQLTDENIEKLKQAYLYVTDTYNTINHRILFYKENVGRRDIGINEILTSDYYDSTTKRINLMAFASSFSGYDYVAIMYENDDINLSPLYTKYLSSANPNYNVIEKQTNAQIVAPANFKAVKGHPLCFYYQNLFKYANTDLIPLKEVSHADLNSERVAVFTNPSTGTTSCAIRIKNDLSNSSYNLTKTISLQTVSDSAGSGTTKKIVNIGDSLTANGGITERLLALFEDDVMNIELLGTRSKGSNLNRFDAFAGWSTSSFVNNQTQGGHTNPFYNPATSTFDFSYYMAQQGYTSVDYVFINLGTNDGQNSDADIIENINTMVTSIKNYDSNIKIGLWLPPCRGLGESVNINNLEDTFKAMRINELYINTYSTSNDVSLIPVYTNVNPYQDFQKGEYPISDTGSYTIPYVTDKTHPAQDGYYHIGDVLFAWIKYFAS